MEQGSIKFAIRRRLGRGARLFKKVSNLIEQARVRVASVMSMQVLSLLLVFVFYKRGSKMVNRIVNELESVMDVLHGH